MGHLRKGQETTSSAWWDRIIGHQLLRVLVISYAGVPNGSENGSG
jgi:hypothetical protein